MAAHSAALVSGLLAFWAGALMLSGLGALWVMAAAPASCSGLGDGAVCTRAGGYGGDRLANGGRRHAADHRRDDGDVVPGRLRRLWPGGRRVLMIAAGSSAAGAGLAIGTAIGTILNDYRAIRRAWWLAVPALLGAAVIAHGPLGRAAVIWPGLLAQPGALILFRARLWATRAGRWHRGAPPAPTWSSSLWAWLRQLARPLRPARRCLRRSRWPLLSHRSCGPYRHGMLGGRRWRSPWPFIPAASKPTALNRQDAQMTVSARARTWASARQPGDSMEFYLSPVQTHLFGLPPGTYTNVAALTPVSQVFGKAIITICYAWQQPQSWLIDGRFVPACPPHDGSPDRVMTTRP